MKKLLFIFAHPDDESFLAGGTIAKYAKQGDIVELICVTSGQLEWAEHGFETQEQYAQARIKELEEASFVLGIKKIQMMDYMDGKLKNIEPGELEDKLYKKLKEIEPDIVVTFEPRGITNHPDHIKVCLSATYAFQKYANYFVKGEMLGSRDPRRKFVTKLGGYTHREEPKLYYGCIPQEVSEFLLKHDVVPQESYGKPWPLIDDKKITTVIDISEYTEQKIRALSKHKTQREDAEKFISIDSQPLVYQEYYILRMQGEEEIFMGKKDSVSTTL